MNRDGWLAAAESAAALYETLRKNAPLNSDDADQQDALALVSLDLGAFLQGQVALARSGHWSPAYSLGRLINERGEHLIALHHDRGFARRFMAATRALSAEGAGTASRRVTDARGFVRRFVGEILDDDAAAMAYLDHMIEMARVGSLTVHPSAVGPALAAIDNPDEDFLAYCVASMGAMSLYAFVVVAERRAPGAANYQLARQLIRALGEQAIADADRWDRFATVD